MRSASSSASKTVGPSSPRSVEPRRSCSSPAAGAHLVLVTSFAVGHGDAHLLNRIVSLSGRRAAECTVRASGVSWTILRPTWLTDDPRGAHAVTLTQDRYADGMLSRADLAAAIVAAVEQPSARYKTFAVFNQPGEPPDDWATAFAALAPDHRTHAA
jgi:putative NAD(P)-binding protein